MTVLILKIGQNEPQSFYWHDYEALLLKKPRRFHLEIGVFLKDFILVGLLVLKILGGFEIFITWTKYKALLVSLIPTDFLWSTTRRSDVNSCMPYNLGRETKQSAEHPQRLTSLPGNIWKDLHFLQQSPIQVLWLQPYLIHYVVLA